MLLLCAISKRRRGNRIIANWIEFQWLTGAQEKEIAHEETVVHVTHVPVIPFPDMPVPVWLRR